MLKKMLNAIQLNTVAFLTKLPQSFLNREFFKLKLLQLYWQLRIDNYLFGALIFPKRLFKVCSHANQITSPSQSMCVICLYYMS